MSSITHVCIYERCDRVFIDFFKRFVSDVHLDVFLLTFKIKIVSLLNIIRGKYTLLDVLYILFREQRRFDVKYFVNNILISSLSTSRSRFKASIQYCLQQVI